MAGTDITRTARAITDRARDQFAADQIELIRHTIMPDGSNDGELAMFLEVCARYELDPFTDQISAVKFKGKVRNVVGRDGWLALANRHDDFRGVQSYEIREHDHFERWTDDDGHVHVTHKMLDAEGKPTHGGRDGKLRGEIVAGFAYARREGHVDTQFLAYADQYDKAENAWKTHPTAMTVKVPEAMCLRKMYPLSGLFAEGEFAPDRPVTSLTGPGSPVPIDFGDDEELANDLQEAFEILGYTRAKVRTLMRGCESREDRQRVLDEAKAEIDRQGDEEVAEAEVVPPEAA